MNGIGARDGSEDRQPMRLTVHKIKIRIWKWNSIGMKSNARPTLQSMASILFVQRKIWEGPVLEIPSPQSHHAKERSIALGVVDGEVIAVVFTWRRRIRRIISARKARNNEKTDNDVARAIEKDPDTVEVQAEWLDYAVIVMPARRKERITARFDKDVVDWFKEQGKGYQSRMNAVLCAYYEAQKKRTGRAQPIGVSSNHRHGAYRDMVTLKR